MICPTGKLCFIDPEMAQKELRAIKRYKNKHRYIKGRNESRVYFCKLCGTWHLTSKPRTAPPQLFLKEIK